MGDTIKSPVPMFSTLMIRFRTRALCTPMTSQLVEFLRVGMPFLLANEPARIATVICGTPVGATVGVADGRALVGVPDGAKVGAPEGVPEGTTVGALEGLAEGT